MKILTVITGTPSIATFGQQSQQTTITNTDNPLYPRNIILSTDGVRVSRGSIVAGIKNSDILAAMVALEPSLTWPPVISTQPVGINTVISSNPLPGSFSIVASSETGIATTFEWFYSTDNGVTFATCNGVGSFTGALSNVLIVTNVVGKNGYQFFCKVTNVSGVVSSVTVILTVNPDITVEPANSTVTAPAAASFSVTANGTPSPTYQWQLSTNGGVSWTNLTNTGVYTNVTTATMNISNSTGLNANQYRCLVSNTNGASLTTAAILTVM